MEVATVLDTFAFPIQRKVLEHIGERSTDDLGVGEVLVFAE